MGFDVSLATRMPLAACSPCGRDNATAGALSSFGVVSSHAPLADEQPVAHHQSLPQSALLLDRPAI